MSEPEIIDVGQPDESRVTPTTPRMAARPTRRRLRLAGYVAVSLAVGATIAVVAALVGTAPTSRPGAAKPVATARPSQPAGWRWDGSLGLGIFVPNSWQDNDTGCHQDDRPTVIRAVGAVLACFTPTPIDKEYAQIAPATMPPDAVLGTDAKLLRERDVTWHGYPANGAGGKVSHGMYAGWLILSNQDVALYVRTRTRATLDAILDGAVYYATEDPNSCPITEPGGRPADPRLPTFARTDPKTASICYYAGETRIQASTRLSGAAATDLIAKLNATKPGTNAGPGECAPQPPEIDALIVIDPAQTIVVTFQPCRFRLDNGASYRRLTQPLLDGIMKGFAVGYASPGS